MSKHIPPKPKQLNRPNISPKPIIRKIGNVGGMDYGNENKSFTVLVIILFLFVVGLFVFTSAKTYNREANYTSFDASGGFHDVYVGEGKYIIIVDDLTFTLNRSDNKRKIENFALIRAAEIAQTEDGYFIIIAQSPNSMTIELIPGKQAAERQAILARDVISELGEEVGYSE